MRSRPSESWRANQSQPICSAPSALVDHSRSIHAVPVTANGWEPMRTVPRAGIRVNE